MGMGHVPPGEIPQGGTGDDVPRRQHRGARPPRPSVARRRSAAWRSGLGRFGEEVAAAFLTRRGFTVVGRNVRSGGGEIDLVVRRGKERIAVEVKTGRAGNPDPLQHLTARKQAAMRRAAAALHPPINRLGVIAVTVGDDGVGVRWLPG